MGSDSLLASFHSKEGGETTLSVQKCIRHINRIQICNLTPFPLRDAVTSALSQPVEQSRLRTISRLSDDLDITVRRRPRKTSAASSSTKSSVRTKDEELKPAETRGRKTSHTLRTTTNAKSFVHDANPPAPPHISRDTTQTVLRRQRTSSMASSLGSQIKGNGSNQGVAIPMTGSSFSVILPDISQQGLEKVVESRLVETFLAITILPAEGTQPKKSRPASSHDSPNFRKPGHLRRLHNASISSFPPGTSFKDKSNDMAQLKSFPSKLKGSHGRSPSAPIPPVNDAMASSRIPSSGYSVPDYLSAIHRPSVNPTFHINARPGLDFSLGANTSGNRLKVQLWGRTGCTSSKANGKQKEKQSYEAVRGEDPDWSIMQEWEFSLDDLVLLPEPSLSHTQDVPPNTLLVTLQPPGRTYYLPSPLTRPPTPSLEYSSDPEFTLHKDKLSNGTNVDVSESIVHPVPYSSEDMDGESQHDGDNVDASAKDLTRTAGYQQLFELVHVRTLIQDHENTLFDLIDKLDQHFENDVIEGLKRDVSERQYRLEMFHVDRKKVIDETALKKQQLQSRRKQLGERKKFLVSARILEETNLSDAADVIQELEEIEHKLTDLRAKLTTMRLHLLSTLASIYPIELYSPPDLLYTILDVPLPIPQSPSDPAPPLSLPNHRSINEDTIASAFGYVAQLLQLSAAYLGKALIYPVTCIGSRSLIKDGISAMVGPRMFPLFSKGVDTYRFEYAVFLLNKDIDMLMAERDLRALDMRHTLPNLKNFILTVTHGELSSLDHKPPPESPALSMLGLDSLVEEEPLNEAGSVTPKGKKDVSLPDESTTPPASGSTTPTVAEDEKKHKVFLGGLVSFPDFLRVRYPSSSRMPVKSVPGASGGGRSITDISGSYENGSEAPQSHLESGGNHYKERSPDLEDVPNRRSSDSTIIHGSEGATTEPKMEEGSLEAGSTVVAIQNGH